MLALLIVLEVDVLAIVLQGVAGLLGVISLLLTGEIRETSGLTVLLHVIGEHAGFQELSIAVTAHEGSFSLVLLLVLLELTQLGEAGIAVSEVALEWFLAVVDSEVSVEVALLSEGFFASIFRADERSLSSVESHVNL